MTMPTLLSKADAMLYAADALERRSSDLHLSKVLADAFKDMPESQILDMNTDPHAVEALRHLREEAATVVDLGLQMAVMKAAAAEIRLHANEIKLVEARAAAAGDRVRS